MQTLFIVLQLVVSLLLIVVVLSQEGKDPGMRGIQGASSDMGDSFFKKAGGTTKEAMFTKLTATLAILFLITTLTLVILAS
ncbi:MAG: preprotein translocase subunit SecG [Clostridia bacterium]